jgi:diadenosine tetraphosphate (Ap4A) HIT family hydrolase
MTATEDPWSLQELGSGCHLCPPRRSANLGAFLIAELSVSGLYLVKDQRFRGLCTLILNDHVTQLDALTENVYAAFLRDLRVSVRAVRSTVKADHMNVELLGNSCPHLHWFVAPRFRSDPRWGRPIWDDSTQHAMRDNPVSLSEEQYAEIKACIRTALGTAGNLPAH